MHPARTQETLNPGLSETERAAVREQLERMLSSPLFSHSRRYPNLLRHVVERTLEGRGDELKERTIGVEVFGREPGYDTNADPVVRATAGEIRKRIAQYYHGGHEDEVRIDLLPGSYMPEFRLPAEKPIEVCTPRPGPALVVRPERSRTLYIACAALLAAAAFGSAWFWMAKNPTDLEKFWQPVLTDSRAVLLCVGQRRFLGAAPEVAGQDMGDISKFAGDRSGPGDPVSLFKLYYLGSRNVEISDVITLAYLSGLMQSHAKPFRIRAETSTTLADLRDAPVVLIGAFNNDWTLRLTGPLRFTFEREKDTFWLKDRTKPARKNWAIDYSTPYLNVTEDYALISRVLDPMTERMVIVAGGLTSFGTQAAGEFLTNRVYMKALARKAPRGWDRRNMQIVVATHVIDGTSGPPRVLEAHFW